MYLANKIIRTISLVGVCALAVTAARAVSPPPDGGYSNGNTAEGTDALFSLTTGLGNTALGQNALYNNTTGNYNTATGQNVLYGNTTGTYNTATGLGALASNTTGYFNTASGSNALFENTKGAYNTGTGMDALMFNTTGSENTASGFEALFENTIGGGNTAVGTSALRNNTTGSNNISVGNSAGTYLTKGSNNIYIGAFGAAVESNTMRLGKYGLQKTTFVAGVSGSVVPGGVNVIVDSLGHFGTVVSSAHYKDAIKPMDKASEAILALEPVTFRYKHELDPAGIPQFGLVAEQVEKVNPDLVARDEQGRPYTVRYEAVNAMLLNEFLKEHRKVEQQDRKIEQLEATVASLQSALTEQALQIQKVSDQLAASQTARPILVNNR